MANIEIAQKSFSVGASRERVWRLIGKVIFSSLPNMENVEILDENNFRAVLRMKVLGIKLDMKVKGEVVDMVPPESFAVRLGLEGPAGFFPMTQKVGFAISPREKGETFVTCKATAEQMGSFSRLFLLGQARRFAQGIFEAIEKRLMDLA